MGRDNNAVADGRIRELALEQLCDSYADPERKPRSLDELAEAALIEIAVHEEQDDPTEADTEP